VGGYWNAAVGSSPIGDEARRIERRIASRLGVRVTVSGKTE